MTCKPIVRLWDSPSMGLIVLYPSGVICTNQTGGHSCLQPKEEGVFVPLHYETMPGELEQATALADYFYGPKWLGWCTSGIDEET